MYELTLEPIQCKKRVFNHIFITAINSMRLIMKIVRIKRKKYGFYFIIPACNIINTVKTTTKNTELFLLIYLYPMSVGYCTSYFLDLHFS